MDLTSIIPSTQRVFGGTKIRTYGSQIHHRVSVHDFDHSAVVVTQDGEEATSGVSHSQACDGLIALSISCPLGFFGTEKGKFFPNKSRSEA
ncbi:hypothetical protein TNCV_2728891 [Trichonephila clavipes]|nr:hypothetical protein TNCV_2728891 [Trichonephila clavipes]